MAEARNEVAMRLSVAIAEGHVPPTGLVNSLILDGLNEIHRLQSQRDRALSAAKEAAGELEALHKAKIIPRGSGEILAMVKAEIAELEGDE